MSLSAAFDDATAKVTLTVASAPTGATSVHLQRSVDQVTWTDVRGAQAVPLTLGAATFLDYEYTAGVQNFYRALYLGPAGSFVGKGTSATGNNTSVTPGLPAGLVAGDLMLLVASIRSTFAGGHATTPTGWVPVGHTPNGFQVYSRLFQVGDTAPTVAFTGGAAGDDTIAEIAAFRSVGTSAVESELDNAVAAQNIAYNSITAAADGMALIAAWKQDDNTSVTTPAGFTQIDDVSAIAGNDASVCWFYKLGVTSGTVVPAGSITVTGGAAAVSAAHSIVLASSPAKDTATVTPAQTAVWLKNPLRPFLNRAVTVVDIDDVTRQSRSALFDVIGRTLPVARTDLQSGRSTTLVLRVTNRVDADDLDGMIAVGEVLFVQPPVPASAVPTMYALPGGASRQRVANTSAVRRFPLGVTECAMPDLTVAAVQSTWVTVTNTYATWADLVAAKATWSDVLQLVGTAADVVTS